MDTSGDSFVAHCIVAHHLVESAFTNKVVESTQVVYMLRNHSESVQDMMSWRRRHGAWNPRAIGSISAFNSLTTSPTSTTTASLSWPGRLNKDLWMLKAALEENVDKGQKAA